MKIGYCIKSILCTGALTLGLSQALFAATLKDIGTTAPKPGALDISQLSNVGNANSYGGLNYYWDNGITHAPDGAWPGQSFTTGSDPGGYLLTSLALKTAGLGNGGGTYLNTNEPFCLNIYILSTNGVESTLIASYTASAALVADGDWFQWSGLNTVLAPNTQYAYGFGRASSTLVTSGWENLSIATNNLYAGGQIGLFPPSGKVSYATASGLDATFDIGLSTPSATPSFPYAPPTNAYGLSNGMVLETIWDFPAGLFNGPGYNGGGYNNFNGLLPIAQGNGSLLYGPQSNYFMTIPVGPNNNGSGGVQPWGSTESSPSVGYADRIVGYFIPPVTTNYVFFISSDDYSQLYLSSDVTESNKQLVAEETAWSNEAQWTTSGGGSSLTQKRSDQFVAAGTLTPQYPNGTPTNAGTTIPQNPNGIFLVASNMYYFEMVHENGGGGYNIELNYITGTNTNNLVNGTEGTWNQPGYASLAYFGIPPSYVDIAVTPTNAVAAAGSAILLSATVSSDATPLNPAISWYRNGVLITNQDGEVYSTNNGVPAAWNTLNLVLGTNDQGSKITAVVTFPQVTGLSYTSAPVTVTLAPSTVVKGYLKREYWLSPDFTPSVISQNELTPLLGNAYPQPTSITALTNFVGSINDGINDYDDRVSGYFIPPTTTNYVFFVSSDDNSDLYLSTDANPSNKRLIAQETQWGNANEWTTDEGGGGTASGIAQKRSDQFTPDGGVTTPWSNGIPLVAGQMYYIEADHEQGGGGDGITATYTFLPDADSLTNGTPTVLAGDVIAVNLATVTNISIAEQPTNVTTYPGDTVTFTMEGATEPVGTFGLVYVWTTNGVVVQGATGPTLTLSGINLSDTNLIVQGTASSPLTGLSTNSVKAEITVVVDTTAPVVLNVSGFLDNGGGGQANASGNPLAGTNQEVHVTFSKGMGASAINPANYTVAGYTVEDAGFFTNQYTGALSTNQVILVLNKPLTNNSFTLQVSTNVQDLSLLSVSAGVLKGSQDALQAMDITGAELWTNGSTFVGGDGSYVINGNGNDIWNSSDGFRYVYKPVTSNFDYICQVVNIQGADQWSKTGLMARETLDPGDGGSRDFYMCTTPTASSKILDGGTGENSYTCQCRIATDGGATEPVSISAADGVADGTYHPIYPTSWLRVTRELTISDTATNDILNGYFSTNGSDWVWMGGLDYATNGTAGPMPAQIYIGICTVAHEGSGANDTLEATVTIANFGPYVVAPEGPVITAVYAAATKTLDISWAPTGGTLMESPTLGSGAVWTAVTPATNPVTVPVTGTSMFFRVQ